jgi:hypothetical protein
MRVVAKPEVHPSGWDQSAKALLKRPWFLTILLATALCVAYLIGVVVNWDEAADRSLYANLGMIPIGLAATLMAISASRTQPNSKSKWVWRLVGAGLACFWAGDVLFFVYRNVLGTAPFPSLADAGYIAYYPLVFAGLLCIRGRPVGRVRRGVIYVGCYVVLGFGVLAVSYLLLMTTLQSSRDDLLAYCLSVGYPLGDMLLLAGIAWILLRRVRGRRWSILLLCAGLIVGLVADVSYGYETIQGAFQSGGFPDAAYMVSWALFAWAGFLEVGKKQQGRTDRRRTDRADER